MGRIHLLLLRVRAVHDQLFADAEQVAGLIDGRRLGDRRERDGDDLVDMLVEELVEGTLDAHAVRGSADLLDAFDGVTLELGAQGPQVLAPGAARRRRG